MMQRYAKGSMYRALIARLDKLHLEPGDFLTVTFPDDMYEHPAAFRDAQQFIDMLAQITGHHVIILRDGVQLVVRQPSATPTIELL